jgi:hypothetical protein
MKVVKRWGVMTLVALLVLGTMGAALAADDVETETETAKLPLEPDSYAPYLDWADGLVQFVFYWGYGEGDPPDCDDPEEGVPTTGSGLFGIGGGLPVAGVDQEVCVPLNVEKNGHYNHGSMVSSFVHWLKGGNLEVLLDELEASDSDLVEVLRAMPKGQLVKEFAHLDFGKGFFELPDPDGLAAAGVETEDADRHGPPASVLDKKAEKAAKGKNK